MLDLISGMADETANIAKLTDLFWRERAIKGTCRINIPPDDTRRRFPFRATRSSGSAYFKNFLSSLRPSGPHT